MIAEHSRPKLGPGGACYRSNGARRYAHRPPGRGCCPGAAGVRAADLACGVGTGRRVGRAAGGGAGAAAGAGLAGGGGLDWRGWWLGTSGRPPRSTTRKTYAAAALHTANGWPTTPMSQHSPRVGQTTTLRHWPVDDAASSRGAHLGAFANGRTVLVPSSTFFNDIASDPTAIVVPVLAGEPDAGSRCPHRRTTGLHLDSSPISTNPASPNRVTTQPPPTSPTCCSRSWRRLTNRPRRSHRTAAHLAKHPDCRVRNLS